MSKKKPFDRREWERKWREDNLDRRRASEVKASRKHRMKKKLLKEIEENGKEHV